MSYSCLEELQIDLDLHTLNKTYVLSKAGCKYDNRWFVVTDDGICYLFDKDGNHVDIRKVTHLKGNHIRKDIKKIVIPDSVTNIGAWAFFNNKSLTSVMISNDETSIGWDAFSYCTSLTNLTFKGKTLEQVKKMAGYPWGIEDESIINVK